MRDKHIEKGRGMSGKQKNVGYTAKGAIVQMPNGCNRGEYQPETSKTRSGYYHYKGFTFSWHNWLGAVKLKKDLTHAKREGMKFYKVLDEWLGLSDKQREETSYDT
jgi:hypothetical protein